MRHWIRPWLRSSGQDDPFGMGRRIPTHSLLHVGILVSKEVPVVSLVGDSALDS